MKGVDGPKYELNEICAAPKCGTPYCERHHLWRRSFLIGDFWWVEILASGSVVGNCVNLCHTHHQAITENKAVIEFVDGEFVWSDMLLLNEPLTFQPTAPPPDNQTINAVSDSKTPEKKLEEEAWKEANSRIDGLEGIPEMIETLRAECPTCHRKLPPVKDEIDNPVEKKKIRKTWSVAVPNDNQEDGADVLDTLIEEIRTEFADAGLPYGESGTAKYHVMATALALFVTHADTIL